MFSKYKDVRCNTQEFLSQVLHIWPLHILNEQLETLTDALKTGLVDDDADTRLQARNTYWAFTGHFSVEADSLLSCLEQKISSGHQTRSERKKLDLGSKRISLPQEQAKQTRSLQAVLRSSSSVSACSLQATVGRSNSAKDCFAAHRAAVRQEYAEMNRRRARRMGRHIRMFLHAYFVQIISRSGQKTLANWKHPEHSRHNMV